MTATFAAPGSGLALSDEAQDLLFRDARTANTFTGEPVSDDQVRAIYDLVKYAPTSMNQQPLRIVLVRSPEARGRLVTHMSDRNQAKTAAAPLVAHADLPAVGLHQSSCDGQAEAGAGLRGIGTRPR